MEKSTSVLRLNALSGIGGVQTKFLKELAKATEPLCLNALSGIGGVQTRLPPPRDGPLHRRLNALSGIGGVRTSYPNLQEV